MRAFELILHEQAWATSLRGGDFQQRDSTDRIPEVALLDAWLVTFWVDHALAEIRVVDGECAKH